LSTWAILLAAGSGRRFGGSKQHYELAGKPLWRWSYDMLDAAGLEGIVVVASDIEGAVLGGSRRQDSVAAGLGAVPQSARYILVHDAARPGASADLVHRVLERLQRGDVDGVVPALRVTDTIKQTDGDRIVTTLDRDLLVSVQTPQGFAADALRACHAVRDDQSIDTDDASMLEARGYRVAMVEGEVRNFKVTFPEDLSRMEAALAS